MAAIIAARGKNRREEKTGVNRLFREERGTDGIRLPHSTLAVSDHFDRAGVGPGQRQVDFGPGANQGLRNLLIGAISQCEKDDFGRIAHDGLKFDEMVVLGHDYVTASVGK